MNTNISLENQKKLISEVFNRAKFDNLKKEFRKNVHKKYPYNKIVGIFGKNDSVIHTIDNGDMACTHVIKNLSTDLSGHDFIVITQFGIEDRTGLSQSETAGLWDELKESTTQSISFSTCLASVVGSGIFILNKAEGSTVLHELKEFHENASDNGILLSVGFLFYSERLNCDLLEQKDEYIFSCRKIIDDCLKNDMNCDFHEHITMSNREPFIKEKNSFLYLIRRYNDMIKIFINHYKEVVK
jgi:hypothetical protein